MQFKAIFLDIDNTLLDFDAYVRSAMETGFSLFRIGPYEPYMYEIFTRENNKLWRQIEDGTLTFEELQKIRWNIIFRALGYEADGPAFERYFREYLNESAIPVTGAMNLLESLSQDAPLYAASNGPLFQQLHRLELGQMSSFFRDFFISEELGVSKPSSAFFEKSFDRIYRKTGIRISPEKCVMIGDSLSSDIAGGKAFGMKTCFFDRKGGTHSFTEKNKPDLIVSALSEIPDLLRSF